MILIKSEKEVDVMRRAGDILARCFIAIEPLIAEGVKTRDIDRAADEFIRSHGASPSFLGVSGFVDGAPNYPAASCISINEEVIHGIPGGRELRAGDVVSVDMGVYFHGYHSDMARTYAVGKASELALRLIKVTEECFWDGVKCAVEGLRVFDISKMIQQCAEAVGFSVVRDFVGHGIGAELHEAPQIPNYYERRSRSGQRLSNGMALAIEPMVNAGGYEISVRPDKWTVVTKDGSLSAHYENTILVNGDKPLILSAAV